MQHTDSRIEVRAARHQATSTTAQTVQKPDDAAAALTAKYTFDLAVFTAILAVATVASIITSIVLQRLANQRDDFLRARASRDAEAVRVDQYARTQMQRADDRGYALIERQKMRSAGRQQVHAILKALERNLGLVAAIPQYDITAEAETSKVLFARLFSTDIADSLEPETREPIYDAAIAADAAMNATIQQQELRNRLRERLRDDERSAANYELLLAEKSSIAKQRPGVNEIAELQTLRNSPERESVEQFRAERESRIKTIEAIYPTIARNAMRAKNQLAEARALLGDSSGPLPLPGPEQQQE